MTSKAREYCLQLSRVLLAWLASRASVSREPCKCGSQTYSTLSGAINFKF